MPSSRTWRFKQDLLHPKQVTGLHRFHALRVLFMVYMDSGRLLPLTADSAGVDFKHICLHSLSDESVSEADCQLQPPFFSVACSATVSPKSDIRAAAWHTLAAHREEAP